VLPIPFEWDSTNDPLFPAGGWNSRERFLKGQDRFGLSLNSHCVSSSPALLPALIL
jgi:hypothetical protein